MLVAGRMLQTAEAENEEGIQVSGDFNGPTLAKCALWEIHHQNRENPYCTSSPAHLRDNVLRSRSPASSSQIYNPSISFVQFSPFLPFCPWDSGTVGGRVD